MKIQRRRGEEEKNEKKAAEEENKVSINEDGKDRTRRK